MYFPYYYNHQCLENRYPKRYLQITRMWDFTRDLCSFSEYPKSFRFEETKGGTAQSKDVDGNDVILTAVQILGSMKNFYNILFSLKISSF